MNSLFSTVEDLARIVEIAEEQPDLEGLSEHFDFSVAKMQENVERRIWAMKNIKALIATHKETIEAITNRIEALNRSHAWLTSNTMELLTLYPNIDFTCSIGSFKIQKNGGKQPIMFEEVTAPHELKRVVPTDLYPQEWVETKTVQVLKPEFEDAVRSGEVSLDNVHLLDRGTHLRIK